MDGSPQAGSDVALEVRGLTRTYGSMVVVDALDLTVRAGDIYGFLGPNGAGKTTAMRCMAGLIYRDAGDVRVFGESSLVRARRQLGAIIEIPAFHDWAPARTNLRWACAYAGLPWKRWNAEIDRVLERVHLTDRQQDRVRTYSLGMRQRLGIARALLGHPRILMLDEPTNGLDPKGMREMRDLVKSLAQEERITVFVSSHILAEVQAMATRVGIIQRGRLRAEGTLDELLQRHSSLVQVRVRATDHAALLQALERIEGAKAEPDDRGVEVLVTCSAGLSIPTLNRVMVERGVSVESLVPVRSTLEDVFLEATK